MILGNRKFTVTRMPDNDVNEGQDQYERPIEIFEPFSTTVSPLFPSH